MHLCQVNKIEQYLRSENIVRDKSAYCFEMKVRQNILIQLFQNMLFIVKLCLKFEILLS